MSKDYERIGRKPSWLKIRLHSGEGFAQVAKLIGGNALHTICTSGKCPNQAECWSRGTATFMIMGDICTRSCKFCATKSGKPLSLDPHEPEKVARSVEAMGLKYCVLTSVDRDDLPDMGAAHWAQVVAGVRLRNPQTRIELLIPDFDARPDLLDVVITSQPDVLGHNIETVERLTPRTRSQAQYRTSLEVIRYIAASGIIAKSGFMVGLGETDAEVEATVGDLAAAGCKILTIGQYLQPTPAHLSVAEYVNPEKFEFYKIKALEAGIAYVQSAPLVRSSYMADAASESCIKELRK